MLIGQVRNKEQTKLKKEKAKERLHHTLYLLSLISFPSFSVTFSPQSKSIH